jgi:tyrosyl-tRNA synthetase
MTMPILVGTDGTRRMGKSLGNYIGVAESPEDQFGKVMSIPDEPMAQFFTLLTDFPEPRVKEMLAEGTNPRDSKEALGKAIVAQYHGQEAADRAAEAFRRRSAGEDPLEIPVVHLAADKVDAEGRISAPILIKEIGFESSTSNARRVIEGGGFNIGPHREIVTDVKALIHVRDGLVVRVGKRKIAEIRLV